MKYSTQKIAYWFFYSALGLLVLQIIYGFIMGFAHMGMDGLHEFIPLTPPERFILTFWFVGCYLALWEQLTI